MTETADTSNGTQRGLRVQVGLLLLVLFSYVFIINAWVGDDAYITFRVIDNLANGHGLRWNTAERVQVYTHPLWLFVMALSHTFTPDFLISTFFVSFLLCAIAVFGPWSRFGTAWQKGLFVGLLLTSKAFMDYTSSGLENPLSYLLLVLFYGPCLGEDAAARPGRRRLFYYFLVASLAFINRQDTVLLYLPALLELTFRGFAAHGRRMVPLLLAATLPAWGWEVFSLVYYGFFFPNTYYAKVRGAAVPGSLLRSHGYAYLMNSLEFDPVTLLTIAGAVLLALYARGRRALLAALAILLYLVYIVRVGGGYMSGRFLSVPFLLAAVLLARAVTDRRLVGGLLVLVLLLNVVGDRVPMKTSRAYRRWDPDEHFGISDERGVYQEYTGPLFRAPGRPFPNAPWVGLGLAARAYHQRAHVAATIGFLGYYAGPHKHIIDKYALTDPLLARLPIAPSELAQLQMGHFRRRIPAGYIASCEQQQNLLADPGLHAYYDELLAIIRGDLFTAERWKRILEFNFTRKRRYREAYLVE